MTTETKPDERRLPHQDLRPTTQRRSDEPYSSIGDEDVDLTAEVGEPSVSRTRSPRITREEVYSTADALLLEGVRPTIDRVRVRLGRGSPNTINEYMDAWWTKLGSRLRDLPGQEFPHLPERVAVSLQKLWNEALEAAHDVLQATLARKEEVLATQTRAFESDREHFDQERQTVGARAQVLEESLAMARAQLEEANQRARTLEQSLTVRERDLHELRKGLEQRMQELAATTAKHDSDRAALQSRYEANESRWLGEVDRARVALKAAETAAREIKSQLATITVERDASRSETREVRAQLATAAAVREQLEARLIAAQSQRVSKSAASPRVRARRAKPEKRVARTVVSRKRAGG